MKLTHFANRSTLNASVLAGFLLMGATLLAFAINNSPLAVQYERWQGTVLEIRWNSVPILQKQLVHWINDGLMAIFFLFVGLDIKRELIDGNLSTRQRAALPLFAAVGGMVAPAIVYLVIAWDDVMAARGWAIPAATDIAFALGILALLGNRVPILLKVFLSAVAVIDDLGAIVIIALFYTAKLSTAMLAAAGVLVVLLAILNRFGARNLGLYLLLGLLLWFAVLKSGVHATLSGVIVASFIPLRKIQGRVNRLCRCLSMPSSPGCCLLLCQYSLLPTPVSI